MIWPHDSMGFSLKTLSPFEELTWDSVLRTQLEQVEEMLGRMWGASKVKSTYWVGAVRQRSCNHVLVCKVPEYCVSTNSDISPFDTPGISVYRNLFYVIFYIIPQKGGFFTSSFMSFPHIGGFLCFEWHKGGFFGVTWLHKGGFFIVSFPVCDCQWATTLVHFDLPGIHYLGSDKSLVSASCNPSTLQRWRYSSCCFRDTIVWYAFATYC